MDFEYFLLQNIFSQNNLLADSEENKKSKYLCFMYIYLLFTAQMHMRSFLVVHLHKINKSQKTNLRDVFELYISHNQIEITDIIIIKLMNTWLLVFDIVAFNLVLTIIISCSYFGSCVLNSLFGCSELTENNLVSNVLVKYHFSC